MTGPYVKVHPPFLRKHALYLAKGEFERDEEFTPFQSIESLSGTEDNLEAYNFIPLSQQVKQEMDEWNHYGEKVLAHLG